MLHIDLKYIMLLSPQLDRFKKLRDYLYNFRCFFCGDSDKFSNKARGYFYRVKDQMNFKCHNCNHGTTAAQVIKELNPDLYKEYVKERWIGSTTEETEEYNFPAPTFEKRDPKLRDLVPINKLTTTHPARRFVVARQIPEMHYDKFFLVHRFYEWAEISSNQDHPRLVLPFWDEDGNVFAAQGRAFGKEQPRYHTVKFDDKPKIYGLDRVDWNRRVYVVEGPIDSLFLHNAIAVAGSDFQHIPSDGTTIVLDNECRSKEIVKKMANLIENDYELVIWPSNIQEKDLNDMWLAGRQDIKTIIDNNTFAGLEARMKLAAWKRI